EVHDCNKIGVDMTNIIKNMILIWILLLPFDNIWLGRKTFVLAAIWLQVQKLLEAPSWHKHGEYHIFFNMPSTRNMFSFSDWMNLLGEHHNIDSIAFNTAIES
ncbi:hypothetical protein ACJX0J_015992, partial [Zea mays]